LTIVLATASSDAVLPQVMRKLEAMGVKDDVVGLVIPTGYSFNLDAFVALHLNGVCFTLGAAWGIREKRTS
jgi:Na+/H+-dicarboxylate symporter